MIMPTGNSSTSSTIGIKIIIIGTGSITSTRSTSTCWPIIDMPMIGIAAKLLGEAEWAPIS